MNFLEATDAPVIAEIDGQGVEFPLWTIGEIVSLCARLDQKRMKLASDRAVERRLSPVDQVSVMQHAEFSSSTPADVYAHFNTLSGAHECLNKSLIKGGKSETESAAIVGRLYVSELRDLAVLVGRLVRPVRKSGQIEESKPDPTQVS